MAASQLPRQVVTFQDNVSHKNTKILKWQTSNAMCVRRGCQLAGFQLKAVNLLLAWNKHWKPLPQSLKCREIFMCVLNNFRSSSGKIWDMDGNFQRCFIENLLRYCLDGCPEKQLFAFSFALCIIYQFSSQICYPQCKWTLMKPKQVHWCAAGFWNSDSMCTDFLGICSLNIKQSPAVLGAAALSWNLACYDMHRCFVTSFEGTECEHSHACWYVSFSDTFTHW